MCAKECEGGLGIEKQKKESEEKNKEVIKRVQLKSETTSSNQQKAKASANNAKDALTSIPSIDYRKKKVHPRESA